MKLLVQRFSSGNESTLGLLYDLTSSTGVPTIRSKEFLCFTLEDEYRTKKVYGETRIPDGVYELTLRTEGKFHERYKAKFPKMHKGMLWVRNVPNFEYILIHIGNTDDDTAGCLLVGNQAEENITSEGGIMSSTDAYKRIYPRIANAIENGEKVKIEYRTEDMI